MAKLKVQAFKPTGKFYTEEIYNLEEYPTVYNVRDDFTVKELRSLQSEFCYNLMEKVTENLKYCPVGDWNGYIFIFENNESGFLTRMKDLR